MCALKILVLMGCLVIASTKTINTRSKRAVGATETPIEEAPYQVSLKFNGMHVCGGALISARHVLTAAHCVDGLFDEPYEELTIVTGTNNLKSGGHKHEVLDIKCHPKFVADAKEFWNHDIAVITLKRFIKTDEKQAVVKLPNHDVLDDSHGHVTGFGRTVTENPYMSNILRSFKTTVLTANSCKPFAVDHKILENQICGKQKKGVGICKGDSGGPLIVKGRLAGIASWNRPEPCGSGIPDVYTNVYRYLDFVHLFVKS